MKQTAFFSAVSAVDEHNNYTQKIAVPQYKPANFKPKLYELCDEAKYKELLTKINTSNVSEEEKQFLRLAASRHIVFNYSKIADYYAHSDKEVQELFEQSALVIIDIDDAIANGYVKLSKRIDKILNDSGVSTIGE